MVEKNNRNCGCGNYMNEKYDCNYNVDGINAAYGYNTEENKKEEKSGEEFMRRKEMLKDIQQLNFSIIELGIYLDTHNNDRRALCLHSEYCNQLRNLQNEYQKRYGPLSIYCPCRKWRWIEEPWPWEGGI